MTRTATKAELAAIPESFWITLDHNSSRTEALKILDALKVDHSGHDGATAALRHASWESHQKGGGASRDLQKLQDRRGHLAAAIGRCGGLERHGRDTTEVLAEIESIKKDIAATEARIAAAGDVSNDQIARRQAVERAEAALTEIQGQLAPYRQFGRRGIKPPERLEDAELAAERELIRTRDLFKQGGVELEAINKRCQKATVRALEALREACRVACRQLGQSARGAVPQADRELVSRFPHRLPPEPVTLYRQALTVNALIMNLGGGPDEGLQAFNTGAGSLARVIRDAA